MKTKYLLFSFLLAAALPVAAQDEAEDDGAVKPRKVEVRKKVPTRKVHGKVVNAATREAMPGVMVRTMEVEGYSTLTDEDGTFELNVPLFASSLEITAPDFNLTKIGVTKGEANAEITLHDVLLYPSTLRADYTRGTNQTNIVSAENFQYTSGVTIESEIQQQLGADVRTIMRSGTPGVGGVMFIGGLNSINSNAQPLIVIDGVIFDQQYSREMLHQGFYNDILSNIAPDDIDKVEILKNGTALYGAKGANGVILIKTRRNKSMATRISASISAGITLEPKHIDVMDEGQYHGYASDMLSGVNTSLTEFVFLRGTSDDPNNSGYYPWWRKYHNNNTKWGDYVYREAISQNYGINVEGGDAVASYNLSLGYSHVNSTLKNNAMNRFHLRFNTDIILSDKFNVRFDASFSNQTRNIRDDGAPSNYDAGTPTAPSYLASIKSPMLSPYAYIFENGRGHISDNWDVEDESYLDNALARYSNVNYKLANPSAILDYGDAENKNRFENSLFNIAITPKFDFNRHLSLSEHFSYNLVNTNEKYYIPLKGVPDYYVAAVNENVKNEVRSLFSKQNSVQSDTRLQWKNTYDAHNIDVFGGLRINWEQYTMNNQLAYNTSSDKIPAISSSLDHATTEGESEKWTAMTAYAQASYNYLQRYYLQATLSAQSSSRFGKNVKSGIKALNVPWGIFPGVQASWVMTNEPWFANVKGIDYLRLTAGMEWSGNDDIFYDSSRSYFTSKLVLTRMSALSFANIGNDMIQWETTRRFNAGLEGNFLSNRLNLRFNFFTSRTSNLLALQSLSFLTGLESSWGNGGKLKNTGFNVSANGRIIVTKDWQWELGASLGHYANKITELPNLANNATYIDNEIYGATIRTQVGQAANVFYGYQTAGVFATTAEAEQAGLYIPAENGVDKNYFKAGDVHFVDQNGDKIIDERDRVVIGNPNPDIYGNIFTSLAFKRFKLDLNFTYSLGNDVYNYLRSQLESGSTFFNQSTAMTKRWQMEGQQTDIPRVTFQDPMGNSRFSDRWIENGSYLKLSSVTLSYDLPINSTFLQGLSFWVQANNLFTITRYLGPDPENAITSSVIGQGIDCGLLPNSRSFVAGIKINL